MDTVQHGKIEVITFLFWVVIPQIWGHFFKISTQKIQLGKISAPKDKKQKSYRKKTSILQLDPPPLGTLQRRCRRSLRRKEDAEGP